MKLNRIILGILAGAALFAGCQAEEAVNGGDGVISVDPSIVEIVSAGETATISVTSSEAWTAKSDSSWVTITPASGAASASAARVTLTVEKNPYEKARTALVTITAGTSKKVVSVSQKAGGIEYGTLENPYTVARAVDFCADLADKTPTSNSVYVKGIISQVVEEFGTQYGNGTFYISDDGTKDGAQFEAYRILYLENKKWSQEHVDAKAKNVAVGDVVMIYGPIQNYGGIAETASGAYLYSIEEGTAPIISCSNAEQNVVASTTEVTFAITPVNVSAWTVAAKETYEWVTDYTRSGEGEANLTVTLQPNTGAEARTAVFVVSAEGAAPIEVSVTQAAPAVATSAAEIVALITSTDRNNQSVYEANIPETAPLVVSYVNGSSVYMEDATGGLLLYKSGTGLVAGDKITGKLSGSGYIFNGLPEVTGLGDAYVKTAGTDIPETVVKISELIANFTKYVSRRVKLEGVTVTKVVDDSNRIGEVAQGEDKVAVYAGLKASGLVLTEGATGDLICFPAPYNDNKQVYYWDNSHFAGSSSEPVKITTINSAEDWAKFAAAAYTYTAEETVTLAADITVTDPVDTLYCNFDGGNHTVTYAFSAGESDGLKDASGTVIEGNGKNANLGLFRLVKNVKISNLKTTGSITFAPAAGSGTYRIGGIVGFAPAGVTIENCVNGADILSSTKVTHHQGGIVGNATATADAPYTISGCTNNGKVEMVVSGASNASQIGGIAGHTELSGEISSCVNNGAVNYTGTGTPRIGGIVGYMNFPTDMKFKNCTNNGAVSSLAVGASTSTSYNYAGGITGYYGTGNGYGGSGVLYYENCINNATISIDCGSASTTFRNRAGGIASLVSAGTGTATLKGCENKGEVKILNAKGNGGHAGGIAGYCEAGTTVTFESCTNDAVITNETGNFANSSTAGILGATAKGNAQNSVFKDVKIASNTVISSTTAGADSKLALIVGGEVGFSQDMTGEVYPCKIIRGAETTEVTADNYQTLLVVTAGTGTTTGVTFAGGAEEAGIKTAAELLAYLANPTSDEVLAKDIDMTGVTVEPATDFTFILDGQNHSVKGLSGSQPLFLKNSGTIKNLIAEGALTLTAEGDFGVFVKENTGVLENLTNKASVTVTVDNATTRHYVGGIAGTSTGEIKNCTNEGAISMTSAAGVASSNLAGIVGWLGAEASGCVNKGAVSVTAQYSNKPAAKAPFTQVVCSNASGIAAVAMQEGFEIVSCTNEGAITYTETATEGRTHTSTTNRHGAAGICSLPFGDITSCINNGKISCSVKSSTGAAYSAYGNIIAGAGIAGSDYVWHAAKDAACKTNVVNCTNNGEIYMFNDCSASNSTLGGIVAWPGVETTGTKNYTRGCVNNGKITLEGAGKTRVGGITGGSGNTEGCTNNGKIISTATGATNTLGGVTGFQTQAHAFKDNVSKGDIDGSASPQFDYVGGLIGGYGNVAGTIEGCEVSANITVPEAQVTKNAVGMILNFNSRSGAVQAVSVGTTESPVKVSGSLNGTALTADNYTNYLVGTQYYDATAHTINAVFGGQASTSTVVEVDIAAYATANSWTVDTDNGYNVESFTVDGVTFKASWSGTIVNGVYWGSDWRFYQARGGGLTISVADGHELVKATFTYNISKTGVLIAPDGSQLPSGTEVTLSGKEAAFTLGNTGTANNGQVRFTKMVVEYK